jgi:hypothetical protein
MHPKAQVFAVLFKEEGSVALAVEDFEPPTSLEVANTADGVTESLAWFGQMILRDRIPLMCCCPALEQA